MKSLGRLVAECRQLEEYRSDEDDDEDEDDDDDDDDEFGFGRWILATSSPNNHQQALEANGNDSDGDWDDEDQAGHSSSAHFSLGERWDALEEAPGSETASAGVGPSRIGKLYIQMEYCDRDLRKLIDEGQLSQRAEEAWRLFRQLLEALE